MAESIPEFVPGKPLTDIWAKPGLNWRNTLERHLRGPLRHPHLQFRRADRARFDLDNLAYPVVSVLGCAHCVSIWATVDQGEPEGVFIDECVPPTPPEDRPTVVIHIANPSTSSVADRPPVPELKGLSVFEPDRELGLALLFDGADVPVGEMSYEGPTKLAIKPQLASDAARSSMICCASDATSRIWVMRARTRRSLAIHSL